MDSERISEKSDGLDAEVKRLEYEKPLLVDWRASDEQRLKWLRELQLRRKEEEWVKVTERLPRLGQVCLVAWNGAVQHLSATFTADGFKWTSAAAEDADQPGTEMTHWKSLPAAPKEGQ